MRALADHYEDETPTEPKADEAACYCGIARGQLYGVSGREDAGDHAGAYHLLVKAQANIRAALRIIEAEQERLCFDYGVEEPKPLTPAQAYAEAVVAQLQAAE